MKAKQQERRAAVQQLTLLHTETSAQSNLFFQTIADRLRLSPTDVKCLNILHTRFEMTLSAIACDLHLTAPAATALLDKLEDAGYVIRERSATDRRRVVVSLRPEAAVQVAGYFHEIQYRMSELFASYTPDQIRLILDFTTRMRDVMTATNEWLAQDDPAE